MNARALNHQILQSTGIVMGTILLSRVLGFVREWTVAHQVGSSAITDAYYAAFTLPDFLNYLVAGGALSLIFIPVFTKYITEGRADEGWHVFSTVLTFMSIALIVLITVGEIFTAQLVHLIAPGFAPAQRSEVVLLTRLMLPAQLFLYLGSVMGAVQNARARFLMPALAAIVYNVGIILGGWLLASRIGITGFAVGLLAGTFSGFFVLQIVAVWRLGAKFTPNLDIGHPGFRMFIKLAIPIMLALSIDFTDNWMIRWFGSYLAPASITWLTYARTLMVVPVSCMAYAVGIASFPFMVELHSKGKIQELNRTLTVTLKGLILFLIPISAITIVLRDPIIHFVFSHTRLLAGDFNATSAALALFSVGMFSRGAQTLVSRGFNATHDTLTPAVVGTAFTFLTLPIYWWCARRWGYLGLAAASSLSVIAHSVVLFGLLARQTRSQEVRELVLFLGRVSLSSAVAAAICSRLHVWLETILAADSRWGCFQMLVVVSAVGFPLIMLGARALGATEIESYWKMIVPRSPKPAVVASE